ncbi:hypothetical protein [Blastopirellula marina]|uniref:Uncharacterized protein n=1 Tax=Blastopirellula marina DSM 3645 TaxID=314230 RepID=A3ZUB0_9BACT|nr:hypothetical protein [Blastopirellula marina]EAQ79813.1 hypothetical protein DSM3645_21774 [Blastopirellula marina DSM 3645]
MNTNIARTPEKADDPQFNLTNAVTYGLLTAVLTAPIGAILAFYLAAGDASVTTLWQFQVQGPVSLGALAAFLTSGLFGAKFGAQL